MGIIQSNINQIIGAATIGAGLYTRSPIGERMAELRDTRSTARLLKRQAEAVKQGASDSTEKMQYLDEAFPKITELNKKRFELQPSIENFQKYKQSEKSLEEYQNFRNMISPQQQAAEKAYQHMSDEQDRIQAQKDIMNNRGVR